MWRPIYSWLYHILFMHSSTDAHLGFHFLAIMYVVAVNIYVYFFVYKFPVSVYLEYRNGMTGSHRNSMFNHLRNFQTVSDNTILQSY